MEQDTGSDRLITRDARAQRFRTSLLFIFCFVFYMNQYVAHCETYTQFLARTLPELCPYSTFCTMGPSKQLNNNKYSPCCTPCSCDVDCTLIGNCCPDFSAVIDRTQPIQPTAKCLVPIHYSYAGSTQFSTQNAINLGVNTYYIFSSCPEGYTNEDVIRKCINSNILEQRDAAMVSDARGRVFFNRYCAKCNGVTTFTEWNLKLVCQLTGFTGTDVFNLKYLADNECSIVSSPPTVVTGMVSRCFPSYPNACNETGKWDKFDSNTKRACESTSFPFFNEKVLQAKPMISRNPYCASCNNYLESLQPEPKCLKDTIDSPRISSGVSFSALIRVREWSDSNINSECTPTDIFDHHFGICRPLHCTTAMRAQDGRCEQAFSDVYGLSRFMQIEATFAHDVSDSDYGNLFDPIINPDAGRFIRLLSEYIGGRCGGCMGQWLHREDKTGGTILLGFKTNRYCSPATLVHNINQFRLNLKRSPEYSIKTDTTQINITMELSYNINHFSLESSDSNSYSKIPLNLMWNLYKWCPGLTFIKPKFYCPYVEISREDYSQLMSMNNSNFHALDFAAFNQWNTTGNQTEDSKSYQVCIDKYLEKPTSGSSFSPYFILELRIMTCVALFCSSIPIYIL